MRDAVLDAQWSQTAEVLAAFYNANHTASAPPKTSDDFHPLRLARRKAAPMPTVTMKEALKMWGL